MQISDFSLENELLNQGYDFVAGVDEAGRGPLAGPVVAAACVFKSPSPEGGGVRGEEEVKKHSFIRDSKTLSAKQREEIFDFICENFYVGVGICDHQTIDRINILQASFLAMKKAISDLSRNLSNPSVPLGHLPLGRGERNILLIDGNKEIPNFSAEQRAVVGGDKIVKSISAASIIAKVTRDKIMLEAHKKYSQYGFDKHKGYGTKLHMEALQKFGPCEIHRRTFAPMSNLAKKRQR